MKLEDLMLKKERTRAEDEQLRNQIRYLDQQARQRPVVIDAYTKTETNKLLSALKALIPVVTKTPQWYPLQVPLTSTAWDGDTYSDTAAAALNLGTVFGVPSGCKMVLVRLEVLSATAGNYLSVGPSTTYFWQLPAFVQVNAVKNSVIAPVTCNDLGNIAVRVSCSGVTTTDCKIEIWGYYK